jgi:hypothetical protein
VLRNERERHPVHADTVEEIAHSARPVGMNSALHYYSAAQRQADALRDVYRDPPRQRSIEQPPVPEPRRSRRLLLALGRG